jgi:hypothetical protein
MTGSLFSLVFSKNSKFQNYYAKWTWQIEVVNGKKKSGYLLRRNLPDSKIIF